MQFFDAYLQQLKDSSLLDHLDRSANYRLEQKLKSMQTKIAAEILNLVDGVLITTYDREANSEEDFLTFMEELRELSGGIFDYHNPTLEPFPYKWNKNRLKLNFTFADKPYFGTCSVQSSKKYVVSGIITAVNWALAESDIEDRFHQICTLDEGNGTHDYGVIYLTKLQREAILKMDVLTMPYVHGEVNITTREKLNQWLNDFQTLGLFDHMTDAEIESKRAELLISPPDIATSDTLLFKIPDIVFTFDTEYLSISSQLAEDYTTLILNTAKLAKGDLKLENITVHRDTDTLDNDYRPVHLGFDVDSKPYTCKLEWMDEWADARGILRILNDVLDANQLPKRFYGVDTEDQGAMYIYLTSQQADMIKTKKLFRLISV